VRGRGSLEPQDEEDLVRADAEQAEQREDREIAEGGPGPLLDPGPEQQERRRDADPEARDRERGHANEHQLADHVEARKTELRDEQREMDGGGGRGELGARGAHSGDLVHQD